MLRVSLSSTIRVVPAAYLLVNAAFPYESCKNFVVSEQYGMEESGDQDTDVCITLLLQDYSCKMFCVGFTTGYISSRTSRVVVVMEAKYKSLQGE